MIGFDEDGRPQLDWLAGVIMYINRQGATANVVRFFKDGDVDEDVFLLSKFL